MTAAPPGDLDLYLFGEGRHRRLWEVLGARVDDDGASFAVWAPAATRVAAVGDWCDWSPDAATALEPLGASGVWWGRSPSAVAGQAYKFEVVGADGRTTLRADPFARTAERPPDTASVLTVPSGAEPPDHSWRESRRRRNEGRTSVYEVHLGSWRRHPDGRSLTAREAAEPLADWAAGLGFTHVELLPVMAHPFGGSWGYQVSGYYAPDARLGTPDDLRYLVDVCHDRGLGVLLDWVPAHFPRDEFALARFDGTPLFEYPDPRRGEHPDWGTLVFDLGRPQVRNFLLANALFWLEEFRVDGLRVDAVASMLYLDYSRGPGEWVPNVHGGREDLESVSFLQELNSVVAEEHPGAVVVAEESTAWAGVTAPVADGGLGFTRKWNLGWMHDTLGYLAHDPVHRSHHHDELTFPMVYAAHERWMLPLSHDEVVHGKGSLLGRMPGTPEEQLAHLRCLLTWQWCHPGRQLLFMGGELAQVREWSHDRELDWGLLDSPGHDGVRRLVAALNGAQAAHAALWRGDDDPSATFRWLEVDDRERSVAAFVRTDPGADDVVAVVANLTPVARDGYRLGVPVAGPWEVVIDSSAEEFGGPGRPVLGGAAVADAGGGPPWQGEPVSLVVDLPPLSVLVLAPVPAA